MRRVVEDVALCSLSAYRNAKSADPASTDRGGIDGHSSGIGSWVGLLAVLLSVSHVRSSLDRWAVTHPAWSWRVSKFLLRSDMVRTDKLAK